MECSLLIHSTVLASLVVFVLGTSMALGIVTGANGFDLRIKTCNESNSGTDDTVSMRFCSGGSTCVVGKPNEYNIYGELAHLGAWNDFVVPLDYEPTTMEISKAGVDAWWVHILSLLLFVLYFDRAVGTYSVLTYCCIVLEL